MLDERAREDGERLRAIIEQQERDQQRIAAAWEEFCRETAQALLELLRDGGDDA